MTDPTLTATLARIESEVTQVRNYHRTFDGDPNGEVDGPKGCQCADTSSGDVYRKTSDLGTKTGWVSP